MKIGRPSTFEDMNRNTAPGQKLPILRLALYRLGIDEGERHWHLALWSRVLYIPLLLCFGNNILVVDDPLNGDLSRYLLSPSFSL